MPAGHEQQPLRVGGRLDQLLGHRVGNLLVPARVKQQQGAARTERGGGLAQIERLEPQFEHLAVGPEAVEAAGAEPAQHQVLGCRTDGHDRIDAAVGRRGVDG